MLIPGNDGSLDSAEARFPHKVPKRILHFSDGTLEEYSTDEETDEADDYKNSQIANIDPSTMAWGSWVYYQTVTAGCKALAACDYMGEALANFFGILSSKYQYEIDEFNRAAEEEKEEQKQTELEMSGWASENSQSANALNQQPTKIIV